MSINANLLLTMLKHHSFNSTPFKMSTMEIYHSLTPLKLPVPPWRTRCPWSGDITTLPNQQLAGNTELHFKPQSLLHMIKASTILLVCTQTNISHLSHSHPQKAGMPKNWQAARFAWEIIFRNGFLTGSQDKGLCSSKIITDATCLTLVALTVNYTINSINNVTPICSRICLPSFCLLYELSDFLFL